jgi:hypothetical protein
MRSATAFLPLLHDHVHEFEIDITKLGSGRISRLGTSRRRGIFHPLYPVG